MSDDLLREAIGLRAKAWKSVTLSPAYVQFAALDAAVEAMGGEPLFSNRAMTQSNMSSGIGTIDPLTSIIRDGNHFRSARKVSHIDAALAALKKAGRPMQSLELLEAAREEGAVIGGNRPIINLTSSLSRSDQIESVRINGIPHWWIVGRTLPGNYPANQIDAKSDQHSHFDDGREGADGTDIKQF